MDFCPYKRWKVLGYFVIISSTGLHTKGSIEAMHIH